LLRRLIYRARMPALTLRRAVDVIIPVAPFGRGRIRFSQTIISAGSIRRHSDANCHNQKTSNERECRLPPGLPRHIPPPTSRLSAIGLHCNCACNAAMVGLNRRDLPEFRCRLRLPATHSVRSCASVTRGQRRYGRCKDGSGQNSSNSLTVLAAIAGDGRWMALAASRFKQGIQRIAKCVNSKDCRHV